MGCGCGGGARRNAQAPKMNMANSNVVASAASRLHPNVEMVQNIQKIAEERRKVEKLRREQLLKALSKP